MVANLSEGHLFEEGDRIDIQDSWTEDDVPEAEPMPGTGKGRGNRYVARRNVERYWEWKALRNHLDDFDSLDPNF